MASNVRLPASKVVGKVGEAVKMAYGKFNEIDLEIARGYLGKREEKVDENL